MNPANRPFDPSIRVTDEIVKVANEAYHDVEASMYDDSHPEILWCERSHWDTFGRRWMSGLGHPLSFLDLGAGTGFVGSAVGPILKEGDRYVATDLSEKMLERLRENLRTLTCTVETVKAESEHIPFPDRSFDIVAVNSALHHFPNVDATLVEASRLLRPGGIFVSMHEPNIRFTRSHFLRSVARFASVIDVRTGRTRRSASGADTPRDVAPLYDAVNTVLIHRNLIEHPLSNRDIQALVDVSSPTARGTYEEVGFDPYSWTLAGRAFAGWAILQCETYNFLGKLDPTRHAWTRALDRVCSWFFPRSGYLFSFIAQKPERQA